MTRSGIKKDSFVSLETVNVKNLCCETYNMYYDNPLNELFKYKQVRF